MLSVVAAQCRRGAVVDLHVVDYPILHHFLDQGAPKTSLKLFRQPGQL